MTPDQAATFFAVMAIGGTLGALVAASHHSTRARLADAALPLAAAVAVGATLGSLLFSEWAHFVPCELCWYQRIAMYPLALILPVAALRRDRSVLPYALALAVIGATIALYHVQLQLFPEQSSFCDAVNPCSGRWVDVLGFMTIPRMSALSFGLIIGLVALSLSHTTPEEHP